MPKKTTAEIGYGSFVQPDLELLNAYKFFFFILWLQFYKFGGMWYTVGKVYLIIF